MNDPSRFLTALLTWFATQQRPLPWRKDYIPYQVWITEIMGQQTQMERVLCRIEDIAEPPKQAATRKRLYKIMKS